MARKLTESLDGAGPALVAADRPRARAAAMPWTGNDWALVVGTGADLVELYARAAEAPTEVEFREAFGEVDLVLVYRARDARPSRRVLLDGLLGRVVATGGMLVGPVTPGGLSGGGRFMTGAERAAFAAGQADALAAMRRALTGMLGLPDGEDPAE